MDSLDPDFDTVLDPELDLDLGPEVDPVAVLDPNLDPGPDLGSLPGRAHEPGKIMARLTLIQVWS